MSASAFPVVSKPFQLSDGRFFQVCGLRWQLHYWLKPNNNTGPDHIRSIMPYVDVVITRIRHFVTFDYSGSTLDQYDRFTAGWQSQDCQNFHDWLGQPETLDYLEAVFNTIKVFARQPHRDFEVAELPFYSHLENHLRKAKQNVATAKQWQETLTKVPGLRPEEFDVSGLVGLWDRHDGLDRISREKLLAALDFRASQPVLVSEAVRDFRVSSRYIGMGKLVKRQAKYAAKAPSYCIERYRHASMGYRILLNRYRDLTTQEPVWIATDEKWRPLTLLHHDGQHTRFQTLEEAKASIEAAIERRFRGYGHHYPSTQWDGYVAPGGEAYREHFLVLANWPVHYVGPHFDLPNILIHLRTTQRTDITGQRLFFLEELQSDWHQLGKRHGFYAEHRDSPPFAPFAAEWAELGLKALLWLAMRAGINRIAWTTGQLQEWRYQRARPGLVTFYDHTIPKILKKLTTLGVTLDSSTVETKHVQGSLQSDQDRWWVADHDGNRLSKRYKTRNEAQQWWLQQTPAVHVTVPVITLSDELKAHLREKGLPLFGWLR